MLTRLYTCKTINMAYVSIIVPCYNSSKTIAQCLNALRASIYKDYELIIVDDHSSDDTAAIAAQFTDKIISLKENKGSGQARKTGLLSSQADITCFIDSDIMIKPDTLSIIINYMEKHPEVDAVTGLLSKEHPNKNFFSQYKNLYMNYTFNLLPEKVAFLFGSVYAIKKKTTDASQGFLRYAPDTEHGQTLLGQRKTIAFLKNLEVVHLKKYTFFSLIKNDFWVPFSWARIFVRFRGWQQLGRNKTGFAHAPQRQLASIIITSILASFVIAGHFIAALNVLSCILLIIWLFLNTPFFLFLFKERGIRFLLSSIILTFIDQIIMAVGIIAGFYFQLFQLFV